MLTALILALGTGLPPDSTTYRGAAGELAVLTPRIDDADVRIDGRLDEPEWRDAALLTDFTLYEPLEARAAEEATEVRVFYGTDAIYFGIRAHDSQPDRIRANIGERDRALFNDDWVRIMLDTFDDRRQAYCFYVTPYGIQGDGLWVEGADTNSPVPIDFNQDYIWESEARIDDGGWTAEIRIPYVSLRFREVPVQSWGFNVARETRRNGYKMSWAPLTKNVTSTLAQGGTLEGLRDLRPKRLVEVNPVATGRRTGERVGDAFEMDGFQSELGVNGRVAITPNLVADATLNPDFSQVEADADQISVNERFALFLTEKRPFFLEGTDIFRTPQQLVYTRRIVEPAGGAKVTGKVGAFAVGYLGALDDSPLDDAAIGERAAFNLLRVRRDLGAGSTVGALYTDRTLLGGMGYNRVASADARIVFAERYSVTTQLAHSWSREGRDGPVLTAPLFYGSFERTGRTFAYTLTAEDLPPDFRADAGFLRRIGDARLLSRADLNLYGPAGALLERVGVGLKFEGFYEHDGLWDGHSPFESEVELNPTFDFRGTSSLRVILRRGYFRFDPEDFDDLLVAGAADTVPLPAPRSVDNLLGAAFFPSVRPASWIQLGGRLFLREIPIYEEGQHGFEMQAAPSVSLWPTDGLSVELGYTRSEIGRASDDSRFSTQDIARIKAQYQFTRFLFARVITQYNLRSRDALRDPATGLPLVSAAGRTTDVVETGDFGANLLLSYEPSPGTLMYLGWSRQMTGPDTWDLGRHRRMAEGLFFKISYLFRI